MSCRIRIFPRFSGRPLYSPRLVTATFWLGNAGVVGLAVGFILGAPALVTMFGVVTFLGVVSFVLNLLCTFASAAPPGVGCGGTCRVPPITIRPPQGIRVTEGDRHDLGAVCTTPMSNDESAK